MLDQPRSKLQLQRLGHLIVLALDRQRATSAFSISSVTGLLGRSSPSSLRTDCLWAVAYAVCQISGKLKLEITVLIT